MFKIYFRFVSIFSQLLIYSNTFIKIATTKSLDGSVHEPMVSIEKFGEILNWFGPIMDPVARRPAVYENVCLSLSS